jgi:hypothetical protein
MITSLLHFTSHLMGHPHARTARTSARALASSLGDALLGVCLSTEARIGADDDLETLYDLLTQVRQICQDATVQRFACEARLRYGFLHVAAVLCRQGHWAQELHVLHQVDDLCRRLPASTTTSYLEAGHEARWGHPHRVTDQLRLSLDSVWLQAGYCLTWGDPE